MNLTKENLEHRHVKNRKEKRTFYNKDYSL